MVAVKAAEDFRQGSRIPQTCLQQQTKKANNHSMDGDILIYLMTWSSSPSFVLSADTNFIYMPPADLSARSHLYVVHEYLHTNKKQN